MTPDVVVIGGGPAGSAAAIRLAAIGMRVTLYEKARFPRPKLCGGFISPDALPELQELGVWDAVRQAGGCVVHRAVVQSGQGTSAEVRLPAPAYSLSREKLDALLLDRARASGVAVFEGVDGFAAREPSGWTVVASGRGPTFDPKDSTLAARALLINPYFGIQAFFDDAIGIGDQVELDILSDHYVGLVRQDRDRVNVCALVSQKFLREHGPSLDNALRDLMKVHPPLRSHLRAARRVAAWQSAGPVLIGRRRLIRGRTFYVGDAACVVDPFAGEGIAMALHGARILSEAFREGGPVAETYARQWEKTLGSLLRMQRLARVTLEAAPFQNAVLRGFKALPSTLGWLAAKTRLPVTT
jgi:flavin-dependent dehydrogenase